MENIAKKSGKETKTTTIRIPMDLYEEIEKEAIDQERDTSKQINYMLKKYFEFIKKR